MEQNTSLQQQLLEAGVHFGHQTKRWNPKMRPYIFEKKNQIYIINLDETVKQLQRATEFLQEVTRRGGKILFVGCKKQAQEAAERAKYAGQRAQDYEALGYEGRDKIAEKLAADINRKFQKKGHPAIKPSTAKRYRRNIRKSS